MCWFVAAADLARRRLGLDRIHFVIVPGLRDGVREERASYEDAVHASSRLWRVHNVVLPVFLFLGAYWVFDRLRDSFAEAV